MTKINKLVFLLLLGLFLTPQAQAEWVDISPSVEITQTRQALDRVKRVLFSYVTITNTSAEAIVDPVRLVIANPSIPVLNGVGVTEAGDAYLEVTGGLVVGSKVIVRVDFKLARVKLVFGSKIQSYENIVAGRVADGYLVGATVCVDINSNRKCDDTEPHAVTTAGGHYSIALSENIDINNYSMVAEVPKGVIDEDDGQPIENGYTLSSPAGKPFFISPISSMIHTKSYVEQITAQQAAETLRLELGLEQSIDMFGDYISSNEMDEATKQKIRTVAKITAKIMENHAPIISAAQVSGLDGGGFTEDTLDIINLLVLGQLKSIVEVADDIPVDGKVTDETIRAFSSIIPQQELYEKEGWNSSQIEIFEENLETGVGSTAPGGEYEEKVCSPYTSTEKTSLAGLKYCIEVAKNEEVVRFFDITYEQQDTLIYLENLEHSVKFTLYKMVGNAFENVDLPFKSTSVPNGRVYRFNKTVGNAARLSEGKYKIVFKPQYWYKVNKAEIHINSAVLNSFYVVDGIQRVNPYELEVGVNKTVYGTLQPIHDNNHKGELIDIIPLRSVNSIASIQLNLKSTETLDVSVINASYLSKTLWPKFKLIRPDDGVLWTGVSRELKNQSFVFSKQSNEDAYYVIISKRYDKDISVRKSYKNIPTYSRYELVVSPQPAPPIIFNVSDKLYKIAWPNLELNELVQSAQILTRTNDDNWDPVVEENEFYTTEENVKKLTSALQTLHAVLSFDEGAMMHFYESYVGTINDIHSTSNLLYVTEELTSIAIDFYSVLKKQDSGESAVLNLRNSLKGIALQVVNIAGNQRAKELGSSFLQHGFNVLRQYQDKKQAFFVKYKKGEAIKAGILLPGDTVSELSQLYNLQQRANLFIQYGMKVYQSTTNLENRTLLEYWHGRIVAIGSAFLPEGKGKDVVNVLSTIESDTKILYDNTVDLLTIAKIQSTLEKMWGSFLDVDSYHSFYKLEVQTNNILILSRRGFQFESTFARFTNQESLKVCIQENLGITDNSTPTVEQLGGIIELTCVNKAITDISVLSYLTNLKSLNLSYNQVVDVNPLSKLTELISINLYGNNILDCSPVDKLNNTFCGEDELASPENLIATAKNSEIELTWDLVSNAVAYNLYYSTNPDFPEVGTTHEFPKQSPYTVTDLTNGTLYYLALTAEDIGGGESLYSESVSATPKPNSGGGVKTFYIEDFSSDPKFISFSSTKAYWDDIAGNYYVRTRDDLNDTYWAHSPQFTKVDPASSEVNIKFDVLFENQNWGTYPQVRFYSIEPQELRDPCSLILQNIYYSSPVTRTKQLYIGDCDGTGYFTPSISNNVWYTVEIHQYQDQTADILIKNKDNNELLFEKRKVSFNMSDFSYLGMGYYDRPNYGSDWSPIRIDNIQITDFALKDVIIDTTTPTITVKLNDTGITFGGNYPNGNNTDCTGTTISQQDCSHGRDVTHNDDSDGHAGFSFTKLDTNGNDLPISVSQWSCVRDNVTGLTWEAKTDDSGIHDKDNTYRWGGNIGAIDEHFSDWNELVNGSNTESLCGISGWRVPTRMELVSVIDYSHFNTVIDMDYFPYLTTNVWSSSLSTYSYNTYYSWCVNFKNGDSFFCARSTSLHTRLVSDGQ